MQLSAYILYLNVICYRVNRMKEKVQLKEYLGGMEGYFLLVTMDKEHEFNVFCWYQVQGQG